MRTRMTMTGMAIVYRRPAGVMRQSVKPQPASGERAAHPSQVKLGRFLAHVDAIAGPVMATVHGRVAAELIVGFRDGIPLLDGGHDLDNYLFPVVQRLGPQRVAAIFGRKIHGPSSLSVGPARPDTAQASPQFSARLAGSCDRRQWKQQLHDRLEAQAATIDPGPATTGPASASRSSTPLAPCWAKIPPGHSTRTMTVSSASACITPSTPASPTT
jgi:hypothetical protein